MSGFRRTGGVPRLSGVWLAVRRAPYAAQERVAQECVVQEGAVQERVVQEGAVRRHAAQRRVAGQRVAQRRAARSGVRVTARPAFAATLAKAVASATAAPPGSLLKYVWTSSVPDQVVATRSAQVSRERRP